MRKGDCSGLFREYLASGSLSLLDMALEVHSYAAGLIANGCERLQYQATEKCTR